MDKARVVMTAEQFSDMGGVLHNATAKRRSTGWVRWYASCRCGWSLDQVGGREGAQAIAEDHNDRLNPDAEPETVCNCRVEVHGRLEYSPPDCPLHKERPETGRRSMTGRYSLAEPLPWTAGPHTPDPADRPVVDEDGPCVRCRKGNHRACRDVAAIGVCCCEVTE